MKRIGYPLAAMVVMCLMVVTSQTASAATTTVSPGGPASAFYIGPGTLTIIWQVLLGLAIGGVAMIGIYRVRVRMFLSNLFSKRGSKRDEGDEGSEDSE